eukprot:TRINITY_DN8820_c1_g2_i1.p1 TRINITY_DN8820_c1_g2~~TRINITY_DN8820_c1_g2_i1.p1  ORF type:complete len:1282 (+),score=304.85 TRINITY_DN8820_c1_g2_i1:90-3935(+)
MCGRVTAEELLPRLHWCDADGAAEESSAERFDRMWRRAHAARRLADFQTFESSARQAVADLEQRARRIGASEHRSFRRQAQERADREKALVRCGSLAAVVSQEVRKECFSGVVGGTRLMPWVAAECEKIVAGRRQERSEQAAREWGSLAPLALLFCERQNLLLHIACYAPVSEVLCIWPRVSPHLWQWLSRGLSGTDEQGKPWAVPAAAPAVAGNIIDLTQLPSRRAVRRLHRSPAAALALAAHPVVAAAPPGSRMRFVAHGEALLPAAAAAAMRTAGRHFGEVDISPLLPHAYPEARTAPTELPVQASMQAALYCDRLRVLALPRRAMLGDAAALAAALSENGHNAALEVLRLGPVPVPAAPPRLAAFAELRTLELPCATAQCAAKLHRPDWLAALPPTITALDLSRPPGGGEGFLALSVGGVAAALAHLAPTLRSLRLRNFAADYARGAATPRPAFLCCGSAERQQDGRGRPSYLLFPAPAAAVSAAAAALAAAAAPCPPPPGWRCIPPELADFTALTALDLAGGGFTDIVAPCRGGGGVSAPLAALPALTALDLSGSPVALQFPAAARGAAARGAPARPPRPGSVYCDALSAPGACGCDGWARQALPWGSLRELHLGSADWPPPSCAAGLEVLRLGADAEGEDDAGGAENIAALLPGECRPRGGPQQHSLGHTLREMWISGVPGLARLPALPPLLRVLSVTGCGLSAAGPELGPLAELRRLLLRDNAIAAVDWGALLRSKPRLRCIDLRDNRVAHGNSPSAAELAACPELRHLLVAGNPCSGDEYGFGCLRRAALGIAEQLPNGIIATLHAFAGGRIAATCSRWRDACPAPPTRPAGPPGPPATPQRGPAAGPPAPAGWECPAVLRRLAAAIGAVLRDAEAAAPEPLPPWDPPPQPPSRKSSLSHRSSVTVLSAGDGAAPRPFQTARRRSSTALSASGAPAASAPAAAVSALGLVRVQGFAGHWSVQFITCSRRAGPPATACTYRRGWCAFKRDRRDGTVVPEPLEWGNCGEVAADEIMGGDGSDPGGCPPPRVCWFPLRHPPAGARLSVTVTRRGLTETVRGSKHKWQVYDLRAAAPPDGPDLSECQPRVCFEVCEEDPSEFAFDAGSTASRADSVRGLGSSLPGGSAVSLLRRRRSSTPSVAAAPQQQQQRRRSAAASPLASRFGREPAPAVCGGSRHVLTRRGAGELAAQVRGRGALLCTVTASLSPWLMAPPAAASFTLEAEGPPPRATLRLDRPRGGLLLDAGGSAAGGAAALDPGASQELRLSLPAAMPPFR